jgi:hypothetical protein
MTTREVLAGRTPIDELLDSILVFHNVHERYAWYLSYSSPKVAITGGNDVTPVGSNSLNEAVIRIRARV